MFVELGAKVVVISGTPGVGKTSVALRIAEILGGKYFNLSEFVLSNNLFIGYDRNTDSFIIDEEKLRNALNDLIRRSEGYIIIDSHYGEIVDDDLLFKLIVLRLDPRVLHRRLISKGWGGRKLLDNLESELVGVCTFNALEEHDRSKVCEVDVTGKDLNEVVREVLEIINGDLVCEVKVDWLRDDDIVKEVLNVISFSDSSRS
ncbi:MAG: adenylate kinase family protein [Sulfolobales archaeon]